MPPSVACFELSVRGVVVESVTELLESRFGGVTTRPGATSTTTLVVEGLDPAAERAVLNLLWDTGHDVVATRSTR